MQDDLIIQRPDVAADAELLLLFHGVGASAQDLQPLGDTVQALADEARLAAGQRARIADWRCAAC